MTVSPQHQMDTTPRQLLVVDSPAARGANNLVGSQEVFRHGSSPDTKIYAIL